MKSFLLKILLFFSIVAVCDVLSGLVFDYLTSHAKGGNTKKHFEIAEKCEPDILILGSSHASRHYIPQILEDSLGVQCYNAGEAGCGILPAFAAYKMISERHLPRLILYEVTPEFDFFIAHDYLHYLGGYRHYYEKEAVKKTYKTFAKEIPEWNFFSKMYQNNSSIVALARDLFKTDYKGYLPDYGRMSPTAPKEFPKPKPIVDSLKMKYFFEFLREVKADGCKIVLVSSPTFNIKPTDAFIDSIAETAGVPYWNMNIDGMTGNYELLYDAEHLNHDGAVEYTKYMVPLIRHLLNDPSK